MFGPLLLFVCAFLWGTAFVAQKAAAVALGPFAVLFSRSVLAAAFLFAWTKLAKGRGFTRTAWTGGALIGVALFLGMLTQQFGIVSTTPGVSAFLTSNYMLIVPILGAFVGRRTHWVAWIGVFVALLGSYLICIDPSAGVLSVGTGEAWTIVCAFVFAVQILIIDRCVNRTDVLALSCVAQVAVVVLSTPFLFLPSETAFYSAGSLHEAVGPVLYLGIVSSGIAYTLQNLGQARTPPTLATIVMSLESVFGALSGYVWFGDVLTGRQLVGCAVLFTAASATPVILARRG